MAEYPLFAAARLDAVRACAEVDRERLDAPLGPPPLDDGADVVDWLARTAARQSTASLVRRFWLAAGGAAGGSKHLHARTRAPRTIHARRLSMSDAAVVAEVAFRGARDS